MDESVDFFLKQRDESVDFNIKEEINVIQSSLMKG